MNDYAGLNLGCGHLDFGREFVNVDLRQAPAVQVLADLDYYPWPFRSGWAEDIKFYDLYEHLREPFKPLEECWRILRPHGRVTIHTNYWKTENSFSDPSHVRFCTLKTMDFYDPSRMFCQKYPHYSFARFHVMTAREDGQELLFELQKLPMDDGSWEPLVERPRAGGRPWS